MFLHSLCAVLESFLTNKYPTSYHEYKLSTCFLGMCQEIINVYNIEIIKY